MSTEKPPITPEDEAWFAKGEEKPEVKFDLSEPPPFQRTGREVPPGPPVGENPVEKKWFGEEGSEQGGQ